jgi:membrane-associated protease RseP (regulator of RpoE activity)
MLEDAIKSYPDKVEANPKETLDIEVRRTREANHGLGAFTVEFCVKHREALIAAARKNLPKALETVASLAASAGLPEDESNKLHEKLATLSDASEWRRWLENVDVHTLEPLKPKRPFALFSKLDPKVDGILRCIDEDHLVVGDIREKLGEADSPAKKAGIPAGAVILSADGKPVTQWYELSEVFRANAGKTIELCYRTADDVHKTQMAVPGCISASLGLTPGARVVKINGETSPKGTDGDKKKSKVTLPDWRAIQALLEEHVGKTVEVEYVTANGERKTGTYVVTADNTDPWLHRVQFSEGFGCYPLFERHPIRNPIVAVGVGFKQAYGTTMQTIQTIRHLFVTHQVGFSKVSGPVGIIRIGTQAADLGIISLLFFLAILSANLAVINFLPIPIVDGGLFLFLLLEKIRGEPVSIKTQVATQIVGIMLIVTVFVLVTYQDIKSWILGT